MSAGVKTGSSIELEVVVFIVIGGAVVSGVGCSGDYTTSTRRCQLGIDNNKLVV